MEALAVLGHGHDRKNGCCPSWRQGPLSGPDAGGRAADLDDLQPVHRGLDRWAVAAERDVDRGAANMRLFAADLGAARGLRDDLSDEEVSDIVWSMNAPEYRALLVGERGWTAEDFGGYLADAWTRLLLA
jgi:hypothetical protein